MLFVVGLVVSVIGFAAPSSAATYNLTSDWSDSTNPNGQWTYLEGNNALPLVSNWT
jgi:hypothetical protein